MPTIVVNTQETAKSTSLSPVQTAHNAVNTEVNGLRVSTCFDPQELRAFADQWDELCQLASDDNAFYSPAFLLSAAEFLCEETQWEIIVVQEIDSERLVGLFPFQRTKGPCGLSQLSLWRNELSFLTTPLIEKGLEAQVIESVFTHIQKLTPRVSCVEFPMGNSAGRVHQELQRYIRDRLLATYHHDEYTRAELHLNDDYETYLKNAIGGHHFREYRRQGRRLNSRGQVEWRHSSEVAQAGCWTDWYLELEAAGWKGEQGTALSQVATQADFFRKFVHDGMNCGSIEFHGLFLDGEPIAIACILLGQHGGFTYKLTFDEKYKKYSPGMLLQLNTMKNFFEQSKLLWLDSCAVPNHAMINRLWTDRRSIEHLVVSTGRPVAEIILGALPLLRNIKRLIRNSRQRSSTETHSEKRGTS